MPAEERTKLMAIAKANGITFDGYGGSAVTHETLCFSDSHGVEWRIPRHPEMWGPDADAQIDAIEREYLCRAVITVDDLAEALEDV